MTVVTSKPSPVVIGQGRNKETIYTATRTTKNAAIIIPAATRRFSFKSLTFGLKPVSSNTVLAVKMIATRFVA